MSQFQFVARKRRRGTASSPAPPASPPAPGGSLRDDASPQHVTNDARTNAAAAPPPPFVAKKPGRYRDRFMGVCDACFAANLPCQCHPERPLRLLLVGHNPSLHAWQSGFSYSNPTNHMWPLLTGRFGPRPFEGVLPADTPIEGQNYMASRFGVGMLSIGTVVRAFRAIAVCACTPLLTRIAQPGNEAHKISRQQMLQWRDDFFRRVLAHMRRVCVAQGCAAGACDGSAHAPRVLAFTGKRQWKEMFEPPLAKVDTGLQVARPPGWPLPRSTDVWILCSSSGRAAMTREARAEAYAALARHMQSVQLPLPPPAADHQACAAKSRQRGHGDGGP